MSTCVDDFFAPSLATRFIAALSPMMPTCASSYRTTCLLKRAPCASLYLWAWLLVARLTCNPEVVSSSWVQVDLLLGLHCNVCEGVFSPVWVRCDFWQTLNLGPIGVICMLVAKAFGATHVYLTGNWTLHLGRCTVSPVIAQQPVSLL